jgi:LysM repeat protein
MSLLGYPSAMDGVEQQDRAPSPFPVSVDGGVMPSGDLPNLCPYLTTIDGTWRSASPVREHRCVAVTPSVPLALDKQRRLCVVADHVSCATYGAAVAARPPFATAGTPRTRVVARTTPVVLDHGRFDLRLPAFLPDRISGQGLLVGLLVIAFAAILVARPGGDGGSATGNGAGPSASPGSTTAAAGSTKPHPSPAASGAPVVTARPVASAPPGASTPPASPAATPQPTSSGSTYKVKSGDTLSAIAVRFGTTVKVLVNLNHIADPSKLHVGQVLRLP